MAAFNLFKQKKNAPKAAKKKQGASVAPAVVQPTQQHIPTGSVMLKGFHISEKAARGIEAGKYTFRVAKTANKQQIKKNVESMFNVNVVTVRVMNMPEKGRTVGRHFGTRSGYRKAIVTLKEGQSIDQAKA